MYIAPKENLDEMVTVLFTKRQREAINAAAADDDRQEGPWIRHIVVRHLELAGYLPLPNTEEYFYAKKLHHESQRRDAR